MTPLALNPHIHIQLIAQVQTRGLPSAEVVAGVDGAGLAHRAADGPVLLEVGVVADDGGRVGALLLPELVGAAVALVAAVLGGGDVVRGVVRAHGFDDVVFHQGVHL